MKKGTLVAKYGSSSVSNEGGMDLERIDGHVRRLILAQDKFNLVVVGSGSVAAGRALWRRLYGGRAEPSKQVLAMMGSGDEFKAWQDKFAEYGHATGQVLLTHREIDDEVERPTLYRAYEEARAEGVTLKLNENDATSIRELAKESYGGENDGLASYFARLVGAEALALFTNKAVFDNHGNLIERLALEDRGWAMEMANARDSESGAGTGGLPTKLEASFDAAETGILVCIAPASMAIEQALAGEGSTIIAKAD